MTMTTGLELFFLAVTIGMGVPDWPKNARIAASILAAIHWAALYFGVWTP